MAIKKVWIDEGCISCGLCEEICPEVFKMEGLAEVIDEVDYDAFEDGIKEAAENCPVEVIIYE